PIRVHFYYTGSANALSAHPCFSQKVVFSTARAHRDLHSFPTRRSSDLIQKSVSLYGGTITRVLMEDYKIEPDLIGRSLELYYRVPYMKYDPHLTLPVDLMENLGASYLRNNLWVPVSGNREEVTILISDPSSYQRIMEIQGILNARNYVFRVGLPEHILQYLG